MTLFFRCVYQVSRGIVQWDGVGMNINSPEPQKYDTTTFVC
jgi:hypothetical protein